MTLQLHLRGSGGSTRHPWNVAVHSNSLPLRAALLSFQVHRGSSPGINGSQAPVGLSEHIKTLFEAAPVEGVVPIEEVQRKEQCNFLVQLYPVSSILVSQFISVCRALNSFKFWSV